MAATPLTDRPLGAAGVFRESTDVVRPPGAAPARTLPWAPVASRVPADLGHASGQRAPRAVRADHLAAGWTLGPAPAPVSRPRSSPAARPGGPIPTGPAGPAPCRPAAPSEAAPPLPAVLRQAVEPLDRAPCSGSGLRPEVVATVLTHRRARTARVGGEGAGRARPLTVERT